VPATEASLRQTTVHATGIVLAGGRSARFGGDKLSSSYHGMPLLHHAILRLAECCDEVVVVIGASAPEPSLPDGVALRVDRDPTEDEGPLVGLSVALNGAATGWALIVGGDMPDLVPGVLLEMLRRAAGSDASGVALEDAGRMRPLPIVVRVGPARLAVSSLLREGERRLRALLRAVPFVGVDEPIWRALDPGRRTLFDVDEPGDLD